MEGLACEKKLDGLFAVSSEWCFKSGEKSGRKKCFKRSEKMHVRDWSNQQMKGVFVENPKKNVVYKVKLGKLEEFEVHLLIVSNNDRGQVGTTQTTPENDEQDHDYEKETSSSDFYSFKQLEQVVERCFPMQIDEFNIKQKMDEGIENVKSQMGYTHVYFVIGFLGQDCQLFSLQKQMDQLFITEKVSQLIIHCALDFQKENCALFFSRDKVVNYFKNQFGCQTVFENHKLVERVELPKGGYTPKTEYYTCLLRGYGNFYYDLGNIILKKVEKERDKRDIELVEAKFYSEPFKTLHRWSDLNSLKIQSVSDMLLDPRDFGKDYVKKHIKLNFEKKLEPIKRIENEIREYIQDPESLCARFEFITRFEGSAVAQAYQKTTQIASKVFNQEKIAECAESIDSRKLGRYLQYNLKPFMETLKTLLADRSAGRSVCTMNDYIKSLVSECMLTHAVYGNIYWRNRGVGPYSKGQARERRPYPKWLIEALEFEQKNDVIQKHGLDEMGLEWYPGNKVSRLNDKMINVTAPVLPDAKYLTERLQKSCKLDDNICCMLVKLDAATKGSLNAQAALKQEFADLILTLILDLTAKGHLLKDEAEFLPRKYNSFTQVMKVLYISNKYKRDTTDLMDTRSFFQKLVDAEFSYLNFVTWFIGIAKYVLGEKFEEYLLECILHFEGILFAKKARFYLPYLETAVAPLVGKNRLEYPEPHRIGIAYESRFLIPNFVFPHIYSEYLDDVAKQ